MTRRSFHDSTDITSDVLHSCYLYTSFRRTWFLLFELVIHDVMWHTLTDKSIQYHVRLTILTSFPQYVRMWLSGNALTFLNEVREILWKLHAEIDFHWSTSMIRLQLRTFFTTHSCVKSSSDTFCPLPDMILNCDVVVLLRSQCLSTEIISEGRYRNLHSKS